MARLVTAIADSLLPVSVLVTFLCYDETPNQETYIRNSLLGAHSFRR